MGSALAKSGNGAESANLWHAWRSRMVPMRKGGISDGWVGSERRFLRQFYGEHVLHGRINRTS
jgi:hypothetical protein